MAGLATLRTELRRLRQALARPDQPARLMLDALRRDRANLLALAGYQPDPWQQAVLRSDASRTLLLCSRQAGKSSVAGALALGVALLEPGSLVLLLSPSERQSGELAIKVRAIYDALGQPVPTRHCSSLRLHLANGSRVVALPGSEKTIRGYSGVRLLVIDEGARVPDELHAAVRPMLAVARGRLVALSTPFGQRGWFWEAWRGSEAWERVRITARQCPRIPADFLAEEERVLGPRWYAQEYGCEFVDTIGALFSGEAIDAMLSDRVQAVPFLGGLP